MIIKKIFVLIVALILVVVATGGVLFVTEYSVYSTSKTLPPKSTPAKVPAGQLNMTVDKSINDEAFSDYLERSAGSAYINDRELI